MESMGKKPWRRDSFMPEFKVEMWSCASAETGSSARSRRTST